MVERVRSLTCGLGVERIIELDIAANGESDVAMLRDNGECVVYGSGGADVQLPFYPLIAKNIQLRFFIVYHLTAADRARATSALTRMLERGTVRHNIGERLPLAQTARAHEMIERGEVTGNLVLQA